MTPERLFPIDSDGILFIAGFLAAGFVLSWIPHWTFRVLGVLFLGLAIFSCFFFRDPARNISKDPSMILSPADGVVMEVVEEDSSFWPGKARVVRIFLSVFDVHVQRSPMEGQVVSTEHRPGKFLDARDPRACFENESNTIVIENAHHRVGVKQIAGLIARRIVCRVKPKQMLTAGQHLGLIRFGSQVDVYLPMDLDVCVQKGERMVGGVSIVAIHKKLAVQGAKR